MKSTRVERRKSECQDAVTFTARPFGYIPLQKPNEGLISHLAHGTGSELEDV